MARKSTSLVTAGSNAEVERILGLPNLTLSEKRHKVLEALGKVKPKKKYASVAERKAAAKKRAEERKKAKLDVLKKFGLEPSKRGPKKSPEEKKLHRKEKGKQRRSFLREMAKSNPDVAKKFGIDINRFKL